MNKILQNLDITTIFKDKKFGDYEGGLQNGVSVAL